MIDDDYTIISGERESVSRSSHLSHMTMIELAKSIKGERSNQGYAMIQKFLINFENKFARLEDEDR